MLLRTAEATKHALTHILVNFSLSQFYDAEKTAKNTFTHVNRAMGIKQFYEHGRHN